MEFADCCGQAWYVKVALSGTEILAFCLHHFTENELTLFTAGWKVVVDRRAELTGARPV